MHVLVCVSYFCLTDSVLVISQTLLSSIEQATMSTGATIHVSALLCYSNLPLEDDGKLLDSKHVRLRCFALHSRLGFRKETVTGRSQLG